MVLCDVKFDNNPQGIYYSGQILSGVVEMNNEKARNIRGLSLRIEGFAKCKWTESEGSGKNKRTITYSGREDYINTFSYLLGSSAVNQTELSSGVHKFNFSCQLPLQLPTSFESKYGYIRYQIKVELERPWKFDIKFCFAFTVIKVLDLNFESPALRSPLKTETTKSFFLGLRGKSLFISVEIPASGFVAGQSVPISIIINNESGVDVEETKISLKKIIYYNSQTPRRKTRERIESAAEVRHSGVPAKAKGKVDAHFNLPAVPPTNVAFCSVIQVSYAIHVLAKVGGLHRSASLRLPIMMGTVPLQGFQNAPTPSPVSLSNWNMQLGSSRANVEASAPYPSTTVQDLPPPSYSEAMKMGSNDADTDEVLTDDKPFSPMYPVFNFAPDTQVPVQDSRLRPPAYSSAPSPHYNSQEKGGF